MKGMRPLHGDQVLYGVVTMMIDCVSPGQEEWSIDFDLESCRGRWRSARQKLGKTRPVPRDLASHLKSGLKDRAITSVAKCRSEARAWHSSRCRLWFEPVTFFSQKAETNISWQCWTRVGVYDTPRPLRCQNHS